MPWNESTKMDEKLKFGSLGWCFANGNSSGN